MTPVRSNEQTDKDEERVAQRYGRAYNLDLRPPPGGRFSSVDRLARRPGSYFNPVEEVIEIKCRRDESTKYATVWAESRKVAALLHWSRIYAATGYFVVEWGDRIARRIEVNELLRISGTPVMRETLKRDDPLDRDVVYEVPITRMEVIP